jgi:fatty-acyl-CoA synthase
MTFYDGRGRVRDQVPYATLRERALLTARRLLGLGLAPGERVAVLAETRSEFIEVFYACQYAGLTPVPVPAVVNLGGREAYLKQLKFFLGSCGARVAFATDEFLSFLTEAAAVGKLLFHGRLGDIDHVEPVPVDDLPAGHPEDVAYIQYTSGSTQVARGAVIKQPAVMCNLEGIIRDGLAVTADDRVFSWLPLYHDMGLVGSMLASVAAQLPVSFLGTRDFALRPRLWLKLMQDTRSTVAFSPPFGYKLAARRLRPGEGASFDLSCWRVAGVGAEMIRPEALNQFAEALAGSGFKRQAFLPCYGMAEVALAVSFSALDQEFSVDVVDRQDCTVRQIATPAAPGASTVSEFVNCGRPLPGVVVEVRDDSGRVLEDRHIGVVWVRSNSAMSGYLNNPEATREVLFGDWVNTGDLGYLIAGDLYITGRRKDMIIVNGRNIWPQDLEAVAEGQPGVRPGDAMAFSLQQGVDGELVVMLVQYRALEDDTREQFSERLAARIRSEFGVDCRIELVGPHALPRTSSGKPSRSQARANYLAESHRSAGQTAGGG